MIENFLASQSFGITAMILVGISWSVWGYAASVASRRNLDMGVMLALGSAIGAAISLIIALLQGIPDFRVSGNWLVMLLVFSGGIVNYIQLKLIALAMRFGPNGIIWSIVQSGFICPLALGIIFFGEALKISFLVSVLLVMASLVVFAVVADNRTSGRWLGWALSAFAATCICQSFQYIPSNLSGADSVSSIWRTLAFFGGMFVGFAGNLLVSKPTRQIFSQQLKNKYIWFYTLMLNVVEVVSCYCFLYPGMDALAKSRIGAISTQLMTAASIIAFELYTVLVLREKRSFWQRVAFGLCLLAIVAICF